MTRPDQTRPDVVGLVMGCLFTLVAAGTLFVAFGGTLQSTWVRAAVPLLLIAVGGAGLAMTRNRER